VVSSAASHHTRMIDESLILRSEHRCRLCRRVGDRPPSRPEAKGCSIAKIHCERRPQVEDLTLAVLKTALKSQSPY